MNDVNLKADMLQAMRRLAKSVTIISTSNGTERFAMAATAVDSLSTEPPSLLICVNKTASPHAALATGADFCVNILGVDQTRPGQPVQRRDQGRSALRPWQLADQPRRHSLPG